MSSSEIQAALFMRGIIKAAARLDVRNVGMTPECQPGAKKPEDGLEILAAKHKGR